MFKHLFPGLVLQESNPTRVRRHRGRQAGQSMVEYVVVVSALLVLVVGSHSAWQAVNGNRTMMLEDAQRSVTTQDYGNGSPVSDVTGDFNPNVISFRDAINVKRERMRDTLSELSY